MPFAAHLMRIQMQVAVLRLRQAGQGKRLEICTVTAEIAKSNELPKGIYIKQVSPDSPAMQAGIQVGDVLTKIDSKEILTAEQYEDCIMNAKDGQQSTVTVKRMGADGKYQDLRFKVVFGTLQEN